MDSTDRELAMLAAGEQARAEQGEAGVRDLARLVCAFREELTDGGIPPQLADELTREWALGLFGACDSVQEDGVFD